MRGRHVSGCYVSLLTVMFFAAALSGSCGSSQPATEVMLVIDADTKAKMLGMELQVEIQGHTADNHVDGMPISRAFQPQEPGQPEWPLSLSITPRGGDTRRSFLVTATLSDNKGKIAVLRAHSGFVAQKSIKLALLFSDDCLNAASLDCEQDETCVEGTCVPAFVDASALPPWQPTDIGTSGSAADGGIESSSSSKDNSVKGAGGSGAKSAGGSGGESKPGDMQHAAGSGGASESPDAGVTPITTAPGDCGDGMINPGEKCDTGIAEGPGACPTECVTMDACKPATLEGSGCQTQCMAYEIMQPEAGDMCCPTGLNSKDDSDCMAECGNGVQEFGEKCDPRETCPTAESCVAQDPSLKATFTGDAETCSAVCTMEKITECKAGDMTCPAGCNHDTDTDCSASCGDGVVDIRAGELCEPTSTTQPCPTSCTDADPCTTEFLTGDAKTCNVVCTHVPVVVPISGDSCCPAGANANSDLDCKATCGNGIVELGERCDGKCPKSAADCDDKNPCTNDLLEGSGCTVRCTHTLINVAMSGDKCCPAGANANNDNDCAPACNNKVIEAGEKCDGNCPTRPDQCPKDTDMDACTANVPMGADCQRFCGPGTLGPSGSRTDGCCPSGADSSSDADCEPAGPTCPNGMREGDENCDGAESCKAYCDDHDDCTEDMFKAGKDGCHGTCDHTKITTGKCMPAPTCGNGMIDSGETCDPMSPTKCPSSCDDGKECTVDKQTGSAATCDIVCAHTDDPTCCPAGKDQWENPNCPAKCPNNHVETGEKCDGNCMPCTTTAECMRAVPGGTECNPTCTMEKDPTCCPAGEEKWQNPACPAACHNGHLEAGEECDPGTRDTDTCVSCRIVEPPPPPPPDPPPTTTDAGLLP